MAWMETHYYSFCMKSNVTLNVLVPTPTSNEQITDAGNTKKYDYEEGLPVVYLLHGAYGDAFSWLRNSNIDRYAQEMGLVVVMASAENSFYQNTESGKLFKDFFLEELPGFIRNVFPVSREREKTFIAGFSMGGYGAWYLALSKPDQYAKAASLSGALDIADLYKSVVSKGEENQYPFNWQDDFGEKLTSLENSDCDLLKLYVKARKNGEVPQLYHVIGKDDFLYAMNVKIRDKMQGIKADAFYEEDEGGHDWKFWDLHICKILEWFAMEG